MSLLSLFCIYVFSMSLTFSPLPTLVLFPSPVSLRIYCSRSQHAPSPSPLPRLSHIFLFSGFLYNICLSVFLFLSSVSSPISFFQPPTMPFFSFHSPPSSLTHPFLICYLSLLPLWVFFARVAQLGSRISYAPPPITALKGAKGGQGYVSESVNVFVFVGGV